MKTKNNSKSHILLKIITRFALFMFAVIIQEFCFLHEAIAQNYLPPDFYLNSKSGEYKGWESHNGKSISLISTKYDEEAIKDKYRKPILDEENVLIYRVSSHDSFIALLKSVFSEDQITNYSSSEEYISIMITLDQKGNILLVCFGMMKGSKITIDQIEAIEKSLFDKMSFTPLSQYNENIQGSVFIRASFQEILAGEIPRLRKQEKLGIP